MAIPSDLTPEMAQFLMALDKRFRGYEQRMGLFLRGQEKQRRVMKRLYFRFYNRVNRRKKQDKAMLVKARQVTKCWSRVPHANIVRLSQAMAGRKNKRGQRMSLLWVTPAERIKLMRFLGRRWRSNGFKALSNPDGGK